MKKLLLFSSILLMAMTANGQVTLPEDDTEEDELVIVDKRKSAVSLGIKAGVNLSTMSKYKPADLGQKMGIGFEGGLIIGAHFGKRTKASDPGTGLLGLQIEPTYVLHSIGTDNETIKLSNLEVPVLLKIFVTPNFNIEIGPNFTGTLASGPDYLDAGNTNIAIGELKAFDVKGCIGVGFDTKSGFCASLRYNLGLSNLAKNFPCKVSAASLTLGYKFNIFKF